MAEGRILIVEDDPKALQLMTDVLQHAGYTVIHATEGSEALEAARGNHPDLVLMDVQLPGMDGLEIARRLKEDPTTAKIRIVAVTSMDLSGEQTEAMVKDCVGYIPKPISPRTLIGLVAAFLAAGRRRKA